MPPEPDLPHIRGAPSRAALTSAALAALCLGCKPAEQPPPRWLPSTLAPADAELIIFARAPASAAPKRAGALVHTLCSSWPAAPLHPCEPARWPAAGLDASQPAAAFTHQGRHALIAPIAQHARYEAWLQERGAQQIGGEQEGVMWLIPGDEAQAALMVASARDHLLITDARDLALAQRAMSGWLMLDDAARWEHIPEQRALARALAADHDLYAVAQPARWLDALPAAGPQAALLRDLLSRRSGLIGAGVKPGPQPGALTITLLHREDSREPVALDALGQAAEPLAAPGAILGHDTPAALHMAFEPAQLWRLWRSTMPPAERKQLDDLLESLREDFMLDLERALIHNAQGHVLITLCGLDPDALDDAPLELLRGLLTLKATQELIIVPLHDGRRMTQALDIFTTLSRGALRRQSSGGIAQYALFDEGALSWVFMVHQDDLLIADSANAFALARAYTGGRAAGGAPPTPLMAEALTSTSGLGLAVQLEPLRALWPALPGWLDDVTSVSAHTTSSPDPLVERVVITVRREAQDPAP